MSFLRLLSQLITLYNSEIFVLFVCFREELHLVYLVWLNRSVSGLPVRWAYLSVLISVLEAIDQPKCLIY